MSNYQEDLSRMLRQARISSGLLQKEVAESLNINRSSYTCYETGKVLPDIITLIKLSEIFSLAPEAFFYPEKFPITSKVLRVRHRRKK